MTLSRTGTVAPAARAGAGDVVAAATAAGARQTLVASPVDDPEAIATWLVRLYDDPELRQRLGSAGAGRAHTEFTLERQAQGGSALIPALLKSGRRAA